MEADIDRLKAWMETNNVTTSDLAKSLRQTYEAVYLVVSGRRRLSDHFRWRFLMAYGDEACLIFQDSAARRQEKPFSERITDPDKYAAHQAVKRAIAQGELTQAKEHKCYACDKQARDWHHTSYAPEDRLHVVPLCRSCHNLANRNKLNVIPKLSTV